MIGERMARTRNKLAARTVATLSAQGKHSDGGGLYLRIDGVAGSIRRRWVMRYVWRGRTREMGGETEPNHRRLVGGVTSGALIFRVHERREISNT